MVLPPVSTTLYFRRFYLPTLQLKIDREQEALRLKAQDEDEANGIVPPGTEAVDNVKGSRVQLDLHSGRDVTEVDWAALLDGSRVLELLYRLEVHCSTVAEMVSVGGVAH